MRPIMAKAINYMKPDIDPNTRLYVPFNEGVGDLAKDYSQYCNHAQLTDVEWSPDGFNGAGKFNGSSSLGDCGNDTSLNTTDIISVDGGFKTSYTVPSGYVSLISGIVGGDNNRIYYGVDNYIKFEIYDGTNNPSVSSGVAIQDGIWHQVIAERDISEDKLKIYLDSILRQSVTDTTTSSITGSGNLMISEVGHYFDGVINNISIISTIRSPAQIAADCYEVVCS